MRESDTGSAVMRSGFSGGPHTACCFLRLVRKLVSSALVGYNVLDSRP
jgi:hypothetical protein